MRIGKQRKTDKQIKTEKLPMFNRYWKELGWICGFAWFIRKMPGFNGHFNGALCPYFKRQCPGGIAWTDKCGVIKERAKYG